MIDDLDLGDLVTVIPARTGIYMIVGEEIYNEQFIKEHDCWLLFSASEGYIEPMGKTWVERLK